MTVDPYEVDRESEDITSFIEWRNTYDTLNKDILLERNEDMKWDRSIQSGDFVLVTGMESIAMAVVVKLQTWFGELKNNPTYKEWGDKAWFYVKNNDTELTRMELKEYVRQALSEIRRIKSVDSIELFKYPVRPVNQSPTIILDVSFTTISDQVGKVSAEVG
jgi:hypothetical protein